jgi:hypothetical protein
MIHAYPADNGNPAEQHRHELETHSTSHQH